jgi:hypothetical protein
MSVFHTWVFVILLGMAGLYDLIRRIIRSIEGDAVARKLEASANARAVALLRDEFEAHVRTTDKAIANLVKEMKATVGGFDERLRALETGAAERHVRPNTWQR